MSAPSLRTPPLSPPGVILRIPPVIAAAYPCPMTTQLVAVLGRGAVDPDTPFLLEMDGHGKNTLLYDQVSYEKFGQRS